MFVTKPLRLCLGLLVFCCFGNPLLSDEDVAVETVFLTDFPAPGIPGDVAILEANFTGVINQSGEFGALMNLTGPEAMDAAVFGGAPVLP